MCVFEYTYAPMGPIANIGGWGSPSVSLPKSFVLYESVTLALSRAIQYNLWYSIGIGLGIGSKAILVT